MLAPTRFVLWFGLGLLLSPGGLAQDVLATYGGDSSADGFGNALAGGSDVDADGVPDLLVGAPGDDTFGDSSGNARVISGATGQVLWSVFGANAGDELGSSVAFVGDLNQDGHADWVVGAPRTEATLQSAGRAEVYSGLDGSLLWTLGSGMTVQDEWGTAVAGLGDVDGDGISDVAVSATAVGNNRGKVVVTSGAGGAVLYEIDGSQAFGRFGTSICALGDVDGDSRMDFAVGAPLESSASHRGVVRVFSGASGGLLQTILGSQSTNRRFGFSLASAADRDGDGVLELIVGSPWPQGEGRAYVYSPVTGQVQLELSSGLVADGFGSAVHGPEDVSGNGAPDLLVGAHRDGEGGFQRGAAWLFSGLDGQALWTVRGLEDADRLGIALASLGDINGDGLSEVLLGANQFPISTTPGPGFVQVVGLEPGPLTLLDFETEDDLITILQNGQKLEPEDQFGLLIRVEGQGPENFGAAVFDSDPSGPNASGPAQGLLVDQGNLLILQQTGAQQGGQFLVPEDALAGGTLRIDLQQVGELESIDLIDLGVDLPSSDSTVTLQDLQGRHRIYTVPPGWTANGAARTLNLATLAAQPGALAEAQASEAPGFDRKSVVRLQVHLGGRGAIDNLRLRPGDMPAPIETDFLGVHTGNTNSGFGEGLCTVGDVNADGVPDFLIGAPFFGYARLYSGSDGAELRQHSGTFTGLSVTSAGDVDGDGTNDYAIGWSTNSAGIRQVLVYSGATGSTLYAALDDEKDTDGFGVTCAGVGDCNGDGVPDLAVGAPNDDRNGTSSGRVWLFSGATGQVLWFRDGPSANTYLGHLVREYGDQNGDGFADVLAVARAASGPRRVLVLSGVDGQILQEVQGGGPIGFGDSLTGTGDQDGDGVPDFLVGAPTFNGNSGTARLFSGFDGSVIHEFFGEGPVKNFSDSLSRAGDVNGDGLEDLLIASPFQAADNGGTGVVYVFSGGSFALLRTYAYRSSAPGPESEQFGHMVSRAGDLDGDGFDDLLVATIRDWIDDGFVRSVWRISSAGSVGTVYCLGSENSTGLQASLTGYGSDIASVNNLTLTTAGLPMGATCMLINSMALGVVNQPFAGGVASDGNLCIAGAPITRHAPVAASGSSYVQVLDLSQIPTGLGSAAILAGESRLWQTWYRDSGFPGRSNFSDAFGVFFH